MTDNNLFSIIPYKGKLLRLENAESAMAYYQHYAINLLTGKKLDYDFKNWTVENQSFLLSSKVQSPRVVHLFYELGFLIENEFDLLDEEALLAIDIKFSSFCFTAPQDFNKIKLEPCLSPQFEDYKKTFETGYQELLKGNCYQFNLTYPYLYSFEKNLRAEDFIFSLWRNVQSVGAYGSATFVPYFNKLFLSNSPECLFQFKDKTLSAMPIKGTMSRNEAEDWKPLWNILKNDKKSQAELYMITDLLRNDLSRIELPRAQVVKKKFPKLVPGLLHQYSKIDVELSAFIDLWSVISKVFPGGSITGAPKKRAMRLIHSLEKRERGFYCGSTLIFYQQMKSASINIRSAVIDFENQTLLYQAGGGITLLSDVLDEFKEMTYKRDSFIHTLTL